MDKLTDLEICKRIAEIDGTAVHEHKSVLSGFVLLNSESYETYNPLTDDALCFKLMVKYNMPPNYCYDLKLYECFYTEDTSTILMGGGTVVNESPNKAICMTIIEAHK